MNIPFSPPDIQPEDIEAVVSVLQSGWITSGPVGREFENSLSKYIDGEGAVLTSSATTALESVLRYLGVGVGDEVIVPAYTYTATAAAAIHVGATVIMVDNAVPGSFFPDASAYLAKVGPKTKAIITVDIGGVPVNHDFMARELLARDDFRPDSKVQEALGRVAIVNDAAHSLGARIDGMGIGAKADFCCLSFHAVKNLTTAEGGAVVWRTLPRMEKEDIYKTLRTGILHGQNKDAFAKVQAGSWEYDIAYPGYKANMPDVLAALGNSQLKRYPQTLERRAEIVRRYEAILRNEGITSLVHEQAGWQSSRHLYLLVLPANEAPLRNRIIELMAGTGVSANVHYKPLPLLSAYRDLGYRISEFPHSYETYTRVISLPLHTLLSDEDVDYVASAFNTAREIARKEAS